MTLLLGIVAKWGLWQSSDHRLVELPSGKVISDESMKHLGVTACDGAAVITYTGFGRVGTVDVSDWLRKTLRGEDRPLEELAETIAARASATFGASALRHRIVHYFIATAYLRGEPFVVAIANTESLFGVGKPTQQFKVHPIRVVDPVPLYAGGGALAVTRADRALLRDVCRRRPRAPADFLGLLAAVNRRAAESGHPSADLITRSCLASYLPPDGRVTTTFFDATADAKAAQWPPHLLRGVDSTELIEPLVNALRTGDMNIEGAWTDDRLRRSVEPE